MKKLFYLMGFVCLLASCSKEPAPEPLVVTSSDLEGTWIYDENGVTEVVKFTSDGKFYYTNVLADAAFAGYKPGTYAVSDNVNVSAYWENGTWDVVVSKVLSNSFVAKNVATGKTITYSKYVQKLNLDYLESKTPDYAFWVTGSITSYASHNTKVATVDKTGAIMAVAEGVALVKVNTKADGAAVVLVEAQGLIPDYAKRIGATAEEIKSEYGNVEGDYNLVYRFSDDAEYEITFYVSRRTKVVERIKLEYTSTPPYITQVKGYLETKYYTYSDKSGSYFIDQAAYADSDVKIEWDNYSEMMFTYINHDLFEDFSIAVGQPLTEVKSMYAELEVFKENDYSIEYKIGEIQIGFTGVDKMDRVLFNHNGEIVTQTTLKLKKSVKSQDVKNHLAKKYGSVVNEDEYGTIYYYDEAKKINVEYYPSSNEVLYH